MKNLLNIIMEKLVNLLKNIMNINMILKILNMQ